MLNREPEPKSAEEKLADMQFRLKKAVEEIEIKVSKPSSGGIGWFGAIRIEDILDIFQHHFPELEKKK